MATRKGNTTSLVNTITFVCLYLGGGGAERVISVLINHFCNLGYKVQLIMLAQNRIDYDIPENVELHCLGWVEMKKIISFLPRLSALRKIIKGDTVIPFLFVPMLYAFCATLFTNKRVIVSERGNPYVNLPGKMRKALRLVMFSLSDAVVFQTEDAKNYFPSAIQKKGVIIPNPIKEKLITKEGTERQKRIVSVCRLSPQKNIPMAIDAFAAFVKEYPEYKYEIYGEGELEQELRNYIAGLGLQNKIILKGFSRTVHEDIVDAMMYVSSSDYEGISNSMLEAMAIGLPVICTDCPAGGARQTITNDHDGILIPVGDVDALKEAMLKIADDKEYRDRIAKNAMEVRERYKAENICREWEKVINGNKDV